MSDTYDSRQSQFSASMKHWGYRPHLSTLEVHVAHLESNREIGQ